MFLVEVSTRRELSILYYLLVGASLVVFYTLLLSFAQIYGFNLGYLIAAAMTITLISSFIQRTLHSAKITGLMTATLTALYLVCFIMMNLQNYSLLMGSLTIFVVLGIIMHAYAKIRFSKPQEE